MTYLTVLSLQHDVEKAMQWSNICQKFCFARHVSIGVSEMIALKYKKNYRFIFDNDFIIPKKLL